jgi:hypothetical protein
MLSRPFATLLMGVALAVACSSSEIVGPEDFDRLDQAKARWDARPFADYSYEIQVFCFCPPEIGRWTRVSVRGGAVTAVEAVEPDPNFPITNLQYWVPIDSIFEDLRRQMSEPGITYYLESIAVRYDAQLGYPTSIEYRAKPNVADGGSTHALRNVKALD